MDQKAVVKIEREVNNRNKQAVLYCTECCTKFKLKPNGQWETYGGKVAEVIQDRLIVCTCGVALGVYAQSFVLPGEVVPIH